MNNYRPLVQCSILKHKYFLFHNKKEKDNVLNLKKKKSKNLKNFSIINKIPEIDC